MQPWTFTTGLGRRKNRKKGRRNHSKIKSSTTDLKHKKEQHSFQIHVFMREI